MRLGSVERFSQGVKMDAEKVCLRLLEAESEAEVQKVIESVPEMQDGENWQPLDQNEANFGVTSNQSSNGGKALTELMTNMVDAVLTKHALMKGTPLRGEGAPPTMYKAVDLLVRNMHGGKLASLGPRDPWLKEFAQENLVIGITGAKRRAEGLPCYTFVDNGEGQRAEEFEKTFLSFKSGHKKSIPFVQGKYNMGSSGVLGYCGQKGFKLIVSRRYDGKSGWGWTLVRLRPDDSDENPVAEYFFMKQKGIPSFNGNRIYPFRTMKGEHYKGVSLETGTIVKLFDYQANRNFLSFKDLRYALNENLVETILPFRLFDFRWLPKSKEAIEAAQKRGGDRAEGVDARPLYGMEFLLMHSHGEEEEEEEEEEEGVAGEQKIHVKTIKDPALGTISISAILLKQKIPGWLARSYNRVFHIVNGQVQHKHLRGYLNSCKLNALKDRVVIIVDSSNLHTRAHNGVWKGDREQVKETPLGILYLDTVKTAIKESGKLKPLQKKIAREELEHSSKAGEQRLFQQLLNFDSNFASLLSNRGVPKLHIPVLNGGDPGPGIGDSEWKEGKRNPTFVRLEERYKKGGIEIPINHTRPVAARTDAENGYLNRDENPGCVLIDDVVSAKFGIREQLHNGRLTIYFKPQTSSLSVGDTFTFKIALKDDEMPQPVESEELVVRICEERIPPPPDPNRKDRNKHKSGKGENIPTLELPKFVLLTKEGREVKDYPVHPWPENFNDHDGGTIEDLGDEGTLYKINYDNAFHQDSRDRQRNSVDREVVTKKYILGMCVIMFGIEHALRALKPNDDNDSEGFTKFEDTFRRMAARGAASTVLTLAETMPKIVNPSSVDEDDE